MPEKPIARYEIALMADRALGLVYPATHEESISLVFQYNASYPSHASRVLKDFNGYLKMDGTIYLPAELLLKNWLILSGYYDPSSEYEDPVTWDPIAQCVALDNSGSTTAFYPGTTKYNFNVPIWTIASLGEKVILVDTSPTPARMLSGQVMIPVYSAQGESGWNSQYENNTLTLLLPEPATFPIS